MGCKSSWSGSRDPLLILTRPMISLEWLKLESSNFLHEGRLYQIIAYLDKPCQKGAWSESRDPFFKFCPNHIFGIAEARHFKYCVPIDTEEYECMRDILLPKGLCSESRDLFKF